MPKTARFFSARVALASLVLLLLGALVGTYSVFRVTSEHVISIKGFGLTAALLFASVGIFIAAAFPTGCATCKRTFSEAVANFGAPFYDSIVAALQSGNPDAIRALAQAPMAASEQRAVLELRYCASCRHVGELRAYEERRNGDYDQFVRGTKHVPASAEVVGATIGLIKHRTPDAAV